MAIATTATVAELVTVYTEAEKLVIMLRQIKDGSGQPAAPGRFLSTDIDTQIAALSAAITAANA